MNPFDPPSLNQNPELSSKNKSNAVFLGFLSAASFALFVYTASNLNARFHDPWMTPRHSPSMSLWWRFGGVMGRVMLLSLPFGALLCFTASTRRKRLAARLLTAAVVAIPVLIGFPT
ncbi:hypothetical protein [Neorhodopirellula lusitana]|uniref:hypothetical protein n=1 Tax=Neorhodopirellula lusitana TaxID=445327 RepID=UPI00384ABFD5